MISHIEDIITKINIIIPRICIVIFSLSEYSFSAAIWEYMIVKMLTNIH